MQNIAEKIIDYYNNEINKSSKPVTLEWLKRQRIVEGRIFLDLKFGYGNINNILGECTYLAKAENMLLDIPCSSNYEQLPQIASLLF